MVSTSPDASATQRRAGPRALAGIVLAVVAWSSVLLQLWLSLRLAESNGKSVPAGLLVYLGYFTVLTNIFVALALTSPALAAPSRARRFFAHPQTLACTATSIALVGLGYHFLLRNIWNPEGPQWLADVLLHYVVPVAFCVYWLLVLPKSPLPWWSPLVSCIYPVVYLVYALVRGVVLGAYPYPFIDVTAIGYSQALRNALGLLVAFVLVGWLFLALGKAIEHFNERSVS